MTSHSSPSPLIIGWVRETKPSDAVDTLLAMTVAHVVYQGETVRYILKSDAGLELQALELGEVRFAAGARVRAGWTAADARIIQEERAW